MQTELNAILAELHEIVELEEKAPEEPWEAVPCGRIQDANKWTIASGLSIEDSTFIARSRNLTPKMAKGMIGMIEGLMEISRSVQASGYGSWEEHKAKNVLEILITNWNKPI